MSSEWWLISLLVLITFLASALMVYPMRRHFQFSTFLVVGIYIVVAVGYYYWGGFVAWQHYIRQKNTHQLAEQMLKSIKNPQELINKLRVKLDDSPKSAKGWYLLGKLYSNQNDNKNAVSSFGKAYHLKPTEEQFAIYYAHSLWQINQQHFNDEIRGIFINLLKRNPNQPDALAMLAMDAFVRNSNEDAIGYWQRLLKIAPQQSEEADAIRKAIVKAEERIDSTQTHKI